MSKIKTILDDVLAQAFKYGLVEDWIQEDGDYVEQFLHDALYANSEAGWKDFRERVENRLKYYIENNAMDVAVDIWKEEGGE